MSLIYALYMRVAYTPLPFGTLMTVVAKRVADASERNV